MTRRLFFLSLSLALWPATAVFAQDGTTTTNPLDPLGIISTIVFGIIGILLCIAGYFAFDRFAGLDLQRELVEDQNLSLGIMLAGVFIGIAIVVSASITG